jgi:hypothetical protein
VNPKFVLACTILSTVSWAEAATAQAKEACVLPQDLSRQIAKAYPATSVVTLAALNESDKTLFIKDHGTDCPGLVRGDFFGDGKLSIAFVLITETPFKDKARLVVGRQTSAAWELMPVDSAQGSVPVVWKQEAREYQDVYGEKKAHVHSSRGGFLPIRLLGNSVCVERQEI